MVNSVVKGKVAERAFAQELRDKLNLQARRGVQYSGANGDPDVVCELPIWFEVKRREKLNIYDAMEKAGAECKDKIPCVAHRKNRTGWLVTLRFEDLEAFCSIVNGRMK